MIFAITASSLWSISKFYLPIVEINFNSYLNYKWSQPVIQHVLLPAFLTIC